MVEIRTFSGRELIPYIGDIAKLRIEIFHEWPYLYEGNFENEKKYLKKFVDCKESLFVIAFDGDHVVGISSGLPLRDENNVTHKPFLERGQSIDDYFYFSESVLKKAYRGQGVGHSFFDEREAFAKRFGTYSKACFCSVIRDPSDPRKPKEFRELDPFWRKRGYSSLDGFTCTFSWQEIGERERTEKTLQFWAKDLL